MWDRQKKEIREIRKNCGGEEKENAILKKGRVEERQKNKRKK